MKTKRKIERREEYKVWCERK